MPDPSVIRIADTYYATGTSSEWAPFYPVFVSKDLVNWRQAGHIFDKKPEWTSNSFWAPELYSRNGTVYCYYTARRKSDNVSYIGVATASSPLGEFTDHGPIIEYGSEAIDAFVYDDDGRMYITWKAYGLDKRPIEILGSALSDDGLFLEGEPFTLLVDDEKIGMEGQYHFKSGDYYYIVYAAHGCCGPGSNYDVYVARAKSFRGPYEKYEGNPILHGGRGDYISCGHGTAVTVPDGRMFYLCHAYFKGAGFYAGRQPVLQEMYVDDEKWVAFRTGTVGVARQQAPFAGARRKEAGVFADKFDSPELKVDWTWNYPYSDIEVKMEKGNLLLGGTPKAGNRYGTALCLRPRSPEYTYQTRVANENESFKGLTMYGDDKNLVGFGVEGNALVIRSVRNGKESVINSSEPVSRTPFLKVAVTGGCLLDFFQSADGKKWTKVNGETLDAKYAVRWDRVARPGLIQAGDRMQPAAFAYFRLENK